jgi:hypothetical protein
MTVLNMQDRDMLARYMTLSLDVYGIGGAGVRALGVAVDC